MKRNSNQKGFTLIEIIVVVVILAILAAMVLPRFLRQTERADIAEAQEILGGIRRAQITFIDTTNAGSQQVRCAAAQQGPQAPIPPGSTPAVIAAINAANALLLCNGDLAAIAMQGIDPSSKFAYSMVGGAGSNSIRATNKLTAANTITIAIDTGNFTCAGYRPVSVTDPKQGCRI